MPRGDASHFPPQGAGHLPETDLRRCQWTRSSTGHKCTQWAMKRSERHYCVHHDKRAGGVRSERVSIYKRRASATLKQLLEEAENATGDERRSLLAELDVARTLAEQAVNIWDTASHGKREDGSPIPVDLQLAAASMVRNSLEQVSKIAVSLAKIEALTPDKLSTRQLEEYGNKLTKILERYLLGDPRLDAIMREMGDIKVSSDDRPAVSIVIE